LNIILENKKEKNMTHQLISLGDCLFNAFTNKQSNNPQEYSLYWAIYEGMRRIDPYPTQWSSPKAQKEHECVRGCKIKDGEMYFKYQTGYGYGSAIKFCAGCMAMVLYYMDVERMTPYMYTHWDTVEMRPVKVDSATQEM
jgi:hypothetical protein